MGGIRTCSPREKPKLCPGDRTIPVPSGTRGVFSSQHDRVSVGRTGSAGGGSVGFLGAISLVGGSEVFQEFRSCTAGVVSAPSGRKTAVQSQRPFPLSYSVTPSLSHPVLKWATCVIRGLSSPANFLFSRRHYSVGLCRKPYKKGTTIFAVKNFTNVSGFPQCRLTSISTPQNRPKNRPRAYKTDQNRTQTM
jgi:hypothetical protein